MNARTQDFETAESDYRAVSYPTVTDPVTGIPIPSTALRTTEDCQNRVTMPYGVPRGLDQNAIMPLVNRVTYGVQLQVLSVQGNGTATVQVTCSAPHQLQTNDQVSIQGLDFAYACGFYSVTVLGATTFTYMTYGITPAQGLLTSTTIIQTCNLGIPRGFKQITTIVGPPLYPLPQGPPAPPSTVWYLELEPGTGVFLLETSGAIELEQQP
jgi:hypothetical protein